MQPKNHANAVERPRAHRQRMEPIRSWPARLLAIQVELETLADECATWLDVPAATSLSPGRDEALQDVLSKLDTAATAVAAIDLPHGDGR